MLYGLRWPSSPDRGGPDPQTRPVGQAAFSRENVENAKTFSDQKPDLSGELRCPTNVNQAVVEGGRGTDGLSSRELVNRQAVAGEK